jgi:hypothetical protein
LGIIGILWYNSMFSFISHLVPWSKININNAVNQKGKFVPP